MIFCNNLATKWIPTALGPQITSMDSQNQKDSSCFSFFIMDEGFGQRTNSIWAIWDIGYLGESLFVHYDYLNFEYFSVSLSFCAQPSSHNWEMASWNSASDLEGHKTNASFQVFRMCKSKNMDTNIHFMFMVCIPSKF